MTTEWYMAEKYEDLFDAHAKRRDVQRERGIHGMRVTGRSTKSVLLPLFEKRANEPRRKERRRRAR